MARSGRTSTTRRHRSRTHSTRCSRPGWPRIPQIATPPAVELIQSCRGALGVSGAIPPSDGLPCRYLRRREFLVGAGIAALAVAAAIPAVLLTRGGGKSTSPPLAPPNAVARIDAETNEVTHVVSNLPVTYAVTSGEAAVWVLSSAGSVVLRVDPKTFAVDLAGRSGTPPAVAAGPGAVWITTTFEGLGYLARARPGDRRSPRRFPLLRRPAGPPRPATRSGSWPTTACTHEPSLLRYPPTPRLAGEGSTQRPDRGTGKPSPSAMGTWLIADARDVWLLARSRDEPAPTSVLYRVTMRPLGATADP